MSEPQDPAAGCAASLQALSKRAPRVHCLTNPVALTLSANALLAVGARPSMTTDPEQVGDFIAASQALCVNLGMLDDVRRRAIDAALDAAAAHGVPWVLDPVKVNLSAKRLAYARDLLA
ncbi:MAG: hydroxyethylthiazole kinase, partial [Candidatus Competibacterales bacterium]|nr:hydroxyethylthiazole kinase [Candidatus Competibacterales bacterium]